MEHPARKSWDSENGVVGQHVGIRHMEKWTLLRDLNLQPIPSDPSRRVSKSPVNPIAKNTIRCEVRSRVKSMKSAEKVIHEDGCHMVILPEGTRTLDGKLQKFKKGGFHMAINTKTPILLIAHTDTYKYKPKNRWTLSPRIINVKIGNVINIENYTIENINELIDKTWEKMNQLI